MELVGFTNVNNNLVFVNPKHVTSIHRYGLHDSEINLSNGIDVQVKGMTPEEVARLLAGPHEL